MDYMDSFINCVSFPSPTVQTIG